MPLSSDDSYTGDDQRIPQNMLIVVFAEMNICWLLLQHTPLSDLLFEFPVNATLRLYSRWRHGDTQGESYDLRKRTETIVHAELRAVLR